MYIWKTDSSLLHLPNYSTEENLNISHMQDLNLCCVTLVQSVIHNFHHVCVIQKEQSTLNATLKNCSAKSHV